MCKRCLERSLPTGPVSQNRECRRCVDVFRTVRSRPVERRRPFYNADFRSSQIQTSKYANRPGQGIGSNWLNTLTISPQPNCRSPRSQAVCTDRRRRWSLILIVRRSMYAATRGCRLWPRWIVAPRLLCGSMRPPLALQQVFQLSSFLPWNKPNIAASAWQARRSSVFRSPDRSRKAILKEVTATEARLATFALSRQAGSRRILPCKRRAYTTVPSALANSA